LNLQNPLRFDETTLGGDTSLTGLGLALCNGGRPGTSKDKPTPVIVQVTSQCSGQANGHYVLVTGGVTDPVTGNTRFRIVDPAGKGFDSGGIPIVTPCPNNPLRTVATCAFLDCPQYNNTFTIRGWVTDPVGDMSELDLSVGDSADLLVTDSSGRRTGLDLAGGSILKEIPNSSHAGDRIDDDETGESGLTRRSVDIFQPGAGHYTVLVSGLKLGTFALDIVPFAQDNNPQPHLSLPGISGPSSTSSFQIQYSPTAGASSIAVRIATFESTLADISNGLQLDLISREVIASHLSKKIEQAARDAAEGDTEEARETLIEFKEEVRDRTPKTIKAIASQILLGDADSLLGQLPNPKNDDDNQHDLRRE
jgi:hypothetical protein